MSRGEVMPPDTGALLAPRQAWQDDTAAQLREQLEAVIAAEAVERERDETPAQAKARLIDKLLADLELLWRYGCDLANQSVEPATGSVPDRRVTLREALKAAQEGTLPAEGDGSVLQLPLPAALSLAVLEAVRRRHQPATWYRHWPLFPASHLPDVAVAIEETMRSPAATTRVPKQRAEDSRALALAALVLMRRYESPAVLVSTGRESLVAQLLATLSSDPALGYPVRDKQTVPGLDEGTWEEHLQKVADVARARDPEQLRAELEVLTWRPDDRTDSL